MNTPKLSYLEYTYNYNSILSRHVGDDENAKSRTSSVAKLINLAWEKYVKDSNKFHYHITKTISVSDLYTVETDYCYSVTNECQIDECFPNYIFDKWEDVKIYDYETAFNELIDTSKVSPTDKRAFWIGAVTHYSRQGLEKLTQEYPDIIDFRIHDWSNPEKCKFVSLKDHCKYAVLVDVRGWGFSARLPLLLATGRPIIIASRNHELWFYHDGTFLPWVHYIPTGEKYGETFNHEAVADAVKWATEHPEEAAKIGKAGQEYAQKYLTRDAIIKKIGHILLKDLS